jgi:uncharacterized cysteine cluster protein YcgN (CxxCxxCC family)
MIMNGRNLCKDCPKPGCCCHYGAMVKGKQVATDEPCPFLNITMNRCVIYNERHRFPECLTIEQMIEMGTVPKWCPYVVDDVAYQARDDTRLYEFTVDTGPCWHETP